MTKRQISSLLFIEVTDNCTSVFAYSIYDATCICQEKFVALFVAHTARLQKIAQNFIGFYAKCKFAKMLEKAKKKSCKAIFQHFTGLNTIWRRRWDLNPCDGFYPSYSLSRGYKKRVFPTPPILYVARLQPIQIVDYRTFQHFSEIPLGSAFTAS